jgi:hypothetical protein
MAKKSLFNLRRQDGQTDFPITLIGDPDHSEAQRRAIARLTAEVPQKPCDIGLFNDEADQLDLVEMFQDHPED